MECSGDLEMYEQWLIQWNPSYRCMMFVQMYHIIHLYDDVMQPVSLSLHTVTNSMYTITCGV